MGHHLQDRIIAYPSQGDENILPRVSLIENESLADLQTDIENLFAVLLLVAEPPFFIRNVQYHNYTTTPPMAKVMHVAMIHYFLVG